MKKDDGLINENSINDLIKYSEDEEVLASGDMPEIEDDFDVPTAEEGIPSPKPPEIVEEEDIEAYDNAVYAENGGTACEAEDEAEIEDEFVFADEKKSSKKGIIIGAVIVVLALIAFFSIDTGIVGNYKSNFSTNFSRMFGHFAPDKSVAEVKPTPGAEAQYKTEVASSVMVSPENAAEAEFAPYKEGILCAVSNHISYIDASGNTVWETDTSVVDPILSSEGSYILLASKGRSKVCLYNDKKLLYDTDDPDTILTAKVSANGDAVLVTDKSSYKGGISVYNKTGAQIYSWASGSDTVISADISSSSRRIAVSLLNTEETAKSIIYLFDINEAKSYAQINVEDTAVFDLSFTGRTLTAFGDNRAAVLSDSGRVIANISLADVTLTHSAMDYKGNKLLSVNDGSAPFLNMYSKRGALKESASVAGVAGFIDIHGKNILYNTGRDIYAGKINSKSMTKYNAAMDIKKLMFLSEDTFAVIYSNSLEIVTI